MSSLPPGQRLIVASFFLPITLEDPSDSNHFSQRSSTVSASSSRLVRLRKPSISSLSLSDQQRPSFFTAEDVQLVPSSFGNVGLFHALESVEQGLPEKLWIGHLGISWKDMDDWTRSQVEQQLLQVHQCLPVALPDEEFQGHYHEFCKQILWKLFHDQLSDYPLSKFTSQTQQEAWQHYVKVNERFAELIAWAYRPGDLIWVNDYHLMLVPAMLRVRLPEAMIGFFLHVPFPSSEIFRCLHGEFFYFQREGKHLT
jgi:trehalose-6-phosphate synthase